MLQKKHFWLLMIGLFFAIEGFWAVGPRESSAIPAWTRKYGADCSMCHYPAVPRLNATGQRFRWMGYRMPDELGKEPDATNVGNYLAARGRGRYVYAKPEEGNRQSEFQWHDTTLFYAGPITTAAPADTTGTGRRSESFGRCSAISGSPSREAGRPTISPA
ncbi:MAG: hypothetical protein WAO55_09240 [Candidatus Manganitrophaceae bacterium]